MEILFLLFLRLEELTACLYTSGNDTIEGGNLMIPEREVNPGMMFLMEMTISLQVENFILYEHRYIIYNKVNTDG